MVVKRSTYPIPDGYRMLGKEELVQEGDKAWSHLLNRFVLVKPSSPLVSKPARRSDCAIRKDDNYLLENIIKAKENNGDGVK